MECKNVWCDEIPASFFRGVQELEISFYDTIRSLFSSYKIPQNLVSLEKLSIVGCDEMVRVIDGEEDEEVSSSSHHHPTKLSLFPSLQQVTLLGLDKLESFCKRRCALELPSLKILEMGRCDEMKSFNAGGSTVTPSLQAITVYNEKLECVQDLNAALYQQFEKAKVYLQIYFPFNQKTAYIIVCPQSLIHIYHANSKIIYQYRFRGSKRRRKMARRADSFQLRIYIG